MTLQSSYISYIRVETFTGNTVCPISSNTLKLTVHADAPSNPHVCIFTHYSIIYAMNFSNHP